jgi:protein-S-isoprenylcysteine O-methyltransferase Ste14
LITGSLLLFFWVFFINYDSLSFFGIRQILNAKKKKGTDNSSGIKKNGILGIMRHPMYFALIIFLWCQTFRVVDIVANTVLTIYIFIGTWLEERKLVLEFGEEYIRYKKEVPMIIPFTKFKVG